VGIEEFVDLDLDEFQRRSHERLLNLVERHRAAIEADLGAPFEVAEAAGRLEISVDGEVRYVATSTAAGRLLVTDVSGRYDGRL
jgi:CRISPR/Cas system-associated protein Csm6